MLKLEHFVISLSQCFAHDALKALEQIPTLIFYLLLQLLLDLPLVCFELCLERLHPLGEPVVVGGEVVAAVVATLRGGCVVVAGSEDTLAVPKQKHILALGETFCYGQRLDFADIAMSEGHRLPRGLPLRDLRLVSDRACVHLLLILVGVGRCLAESGSTRGLATAAQLLGDLGLDFAPPLVLRRGQFQLDSADSGAELLVLLLELFDYAWLLELRRGGTRGQTKQLFLPSGHVRSLFIAFCGEKKSIGGDRVRPTAAPIRAPEVLWTPFLATHLTA